MPILAINKLWLNVFFQFDDNGKKRVIIHQSLSLYLFIIYVITLIQNYYTMTTDENFKYVRRINYNLWIYLPFKLKATKLKFFFIYTPLRFGLVAKTPSKF